MSFDFLESFKNRSTIELLKITEQPEGYQPDALNAAKQLLAEREVLESELEEARIYVNTIKIAAQLKKQKNNDLKQKALDVMSPVLKPNEVFEPAKWFPGFLLVICTLYLWAFYNSIVAIYSFFQCNVCEFDVLIFSHIANLFFIPTLLYLLLKRRRWGWILLFGANVFGLISLLSQSYFFFEYGGDLALDTTAFIRGLFLKVLFLAFLWRNGVGELFCVTKTTKQNVALWTVVGSVVFVGITTIIYW